MPGDITFDSPAVHLVRKLRELESRIIELEAGQDKIDRLLSTSQVCKLLGIHPNTWANWRKRYPKPPIKIGSATSPKYRKSAVIRFAERIGKLSRVVKEQGTSNIPAQDRG